VPDKQINSIAIEKYFVLNVLFWECGFNLGSFSRKNKYEGQMNTVVLNGN